MKTKIINMFFAFLIFVGFNTNSLSQSIESNIKSLSVGADAILMGKVTKQNSYWNKDKTRIFTDVTIEVDEFFKGNNGSKTIVVNTPGGEVGEIGELYSHMPRFNKEEDVLLFVKRDKKDLSYKVFDGENGKITLYTDKKTGEKITASNRKVSMLKKEIRDYVEQK